MVIYICYRVIYIVDGADSMYKNEMLIYLLIVIFICYIVIYIVDGAGSLYRNKMLIYIVTFVT